MRYTSENNRDYIIEHREEIIKRAKPILITFSILTLVILMIILSYIIFGFGLFCPVHLLTGMNCPGCGCTRMAVSIIHGDFYQAFRYNPFVFCTFPIIGILGIKITLDYVLYNKIGKYVNNLLLIYAISLILFGIIRNISMFSWLSPTQI